MHILSHVSLCIGCIAHIVHVFVNHACRQPELQTASPSETSDTGMITLHMQNSPQNWLPGGGSHGTWGGKSLGPAVKCRWDWAKSYRLTSSGFPYWKSWDQIWSNRFVLYHIQTSSNHTLPICLFICSMGLTVEQVDSGALRQSMAISITKAHRLSSHPTRNVTTNQSGSYKHTELQYIIHTHVWNYIHYQSWYHTIAVKQC